MSYRNFSNESETLAARWADMVQTNDHWELVEKVSQALKEPDTESSPDVAQNGPIKCVAKPSSDTKPRAAIEKIASDLAYHLDLPVPAVLLWDRGEGTHDLRYFALIAWAFQPFLVWDKATDSLSDSEKAALTPVFSAIKVFELWISAEDRGSKHTLVYVQDTNRGPQIAFIDYAHSLCHRWDRKEYPDQKNRSFMPLSEDRNTVVQVIEKIENLDDGLIERIVNRIPENYLSSQKRDIIIQNLLSRRPNLRAMLKI